MYIVIIMHKYCKKVAGENSANYSFAIKTGILFIYLPEKDSIAMITRHPITTDIIGIDGNDPENMTDYTKPYYRLIEIPFLKKYMAELLADSGQRTRIGAKPTVILVVGVNGVGKTTTIGKLANYFTLFKYKVILAAGDTFRAAAAEQLTIWGERAHCDVIRHSEGADPAAVVFDAVKAAIARKADILFIDTAGRLHNKANLMNELEKIHRIIKREIPEAPHETFLVLDATTGQNAINQAKVFMETAKVTGVVLTKLDGTAKGGVVVAIKEELGLPVKWIGVGEGVEDLRPFNPDDFAKALFNE